MHHLFNIWDTVVAKAYAGLFCIFLDFDGTLVEIASRPNQVLVAPKIIDTLRLLSLNPRCQLVVISGRSLSDIKQLLGISNILYVGNHGFEFGDIACNYEFPMPILFKEFLGRLKISLEKKFSAIKGVIIEDKKCSLSIHYRAVANQDVVLVDSIINATLDQIRVHWVPNITRGKKVVEITPSLVWHKGTMAWLILALFKLVVDSHEVTSFYFGDDTTDENAFIALKRTGFNVFVGKPIKTQANYYLNCPQEVCKFLAKLNQLLTGLTKTSRSFYET